MTPREAAALLSLGQLSGLEPDPSIAGNLRGAAEVYARVLALAGIDYPTAEAAMLAIVSEPWRSEYRRKLPTTGEIIARTPIGRAVTKLPEIIRTEAFTIGVFGKPWLNAASISRRNSPAASLTHSSAAASVIR